MVQLEGFEPPTFRFVAETYKAQKKTENQQMIVISMVREFFERLRRFKDA